MNKIIRNCKILTFTAIAASLLSGCNDKMDNDAIQQGDISFTVKSETNGSFAGKALGMYMVSKGTGEIKGLAAERLFNNVKYINNGNKYVTTPAIFFPKDKELFHDIYVYTPYRENFLPEGASVTGVSIAQDQTSNENYSGSDLMVAQSLDLGYNSGSIPLEMEHMFGRVNLILKAGGAFQDINEIKSPRAIFNKLNDRANIDLQTKELGDFSGEADIIPNGIFAADGDVLKGVSAILMPQTIKAGDLFITVRSADKEFNFKPDQDITISSGRDMTITLTLNSTFDAILISMSDVKIEDWQSAGDDYTVNTEEAKPPVGDKVKDADGNEYSIIKIGRQYWMGENLNTTRYNDGTPVKEVLNLSDWAFLDAEGGYCSYEFKEMYRTVYGLLYNKSAVECGKLCPPGWHVPTEEDWGELGAALGGEVDEWGACLDVAKKLKAIDQWGTSECDNSTNFSALPGGYLFLNSEHPDGGSFTNVNTGGYWWSMTAMVSGTSYCRTLNVNNNDLVRIVQSNTHGVSVRCIHDF